jgi:hypothetical protein
MQTALPLPPLLPLHLQLHVPKTTFNQNHVRHY